ncbi:MAG: glutathione S-transferase [Hyphomicrobiaceae bacterium]
MVEYTLYAFAQSGNAYKPALMLALSGADWAPRFVDYFNGETRTPAYRTEVNEMGEVPVLEHKGRKLAQSAVILDYLAETLGRFGWRDEDERREILRWLFWDNHKLTSYTATYRFLRTFMRDKTDLAVLDFFKARMTAALGILDGRLARQPFVAVADRPTIADISLAGYLFFDDEIGLDWSSHPNVKAWRDRLQELPGWRHPYDLLPGHPLPAKG